MGNEKLSELIQLSSSIEELQHRVRDALFGQYNERLSQVWQEHRELNAGLRSPYLDDFEDYYRRKLALGQMSLEQIFYKVDGSVHHRVPDQMRDHIKKHILLNPPSLQEIEQAIFDEEQRIVREQDDRLERAQRELQERFDILKRQMAKRQHKKQRKQERRAKKQVMVEKKSEKGLNIRIKAYQASLVKGLPRKQARRKAFKLAKAQRRLRELREKRMIGEA